MARPRKFTPEQFEKAWEDYFSWCDDNPWYRNEAIKSGDRAGDIIKIPIARPYTEIGFCSFHGLGEKYIREMKASLDKNDLTEDEQELAWILSSAIAKCNAQKFEGAAVGAFKENIIARDLGLWDKVQNDHTSKGDKIGNIEVSIVYPNEIE
jgi:hypothetical protein